jgi:hypothetical protein
LDLLVYNLPFPFQAREALELTVFAPDLSVPGVACWLAALSRWVRAQVCGTDADILAQEETRTEETVCEID